MFKLFYKLVQELGLGDIIREPNRIYGGLINKMYKVETTTGIYAFKELNPEIMKKEDGKNNHIIAETVANIAKKNGIDCVCAKIINDNILHKIDDEYFLIFDWFDGKPLKTNEITNSHVAIVARLLAKLHNIDYGDLVKKCNPGNVISEINWDFYIKRIEDEAVKNMLIAHLDDFIRLDKKSNQAILEIGEDKIISHRDLDLPNILWDKESHPAIIDWESAGLVNPSEEFLETAWDWCGGHEAFDFKKFEIFINNYRDNNGHLSNVKKAVYSNYKNKSSWLEFNLKRMCKIGIIDEEEVEVGRKEVIRMINEIIAFYNIMEKYSFLN